MGFWVKTNPKILVDYEVINSTFVSFAESVHCRLTKVVPNDSPSRFSHHKTRVLSKKLSVL